MGDSKKSLRSTFALAIQANSTNCMGIVYTHYIQHLVQWAGGWREQYPRLGCISETIRCRKLILWDNDICLCMQHRGDLDLMFGLVVVTLTFKILSGLCLGNCNWLGGVGV